MAYQEGGPAEERIVQFAEASCAWLAPYLAHVLGSADSKFKQFVTTHPPSNALLSAVLRVVGEVTEHLNLSAALCQNVFSGLNGWELADKLVRYCLILLVDVTISPRGLPSTIMESEKDRLVRLFGGGSHRNREATMQSIRIRCSLLNYVTGLAFTNLDWYNIDLSIISKPDSQLQLDLKTTEAKKMGQWKLVEQLVGDTAKYPIAEFLRNSGLADGVSALFGSDKSVTLDPFSRCIQFGDLCFFDLTCSSADLLATSLPLEDGTPRMLAVYFNRTFGMGHFELLTPSEQEGDWDTLDTMLLPLYDEIRM